MELPVLRGRSDLKELQVHAAPKVPKGDTGPQGPPGPGGSNVSINLDGWDGTAKNVIYDPEINNGTGGLRVAIGASQGGGKSGDGLPSGPSFTGIPTVLAFDYDPSKPNDGDWVHIPVYYFSPIVIDTFKINLEPKLVNVGDQSELEIKTPIPDEGANRSDKIIVTATGDMRMLNSTEGGIATILFGFLDVNGNPVDGSAATQTLFFPEVNGRNGNAFLQNNFSITRVYEFGKGEAGPFLNPFNSDFTISFFARKLSGNAAADVRIGHVNIVLQYIPSKPY